MLLLRKAQRTRKKQDCRTSRGTRNARYPMTWNCLSVCRYRVFRMVNPFLQSPIPIKCKTGTRKIRFLIIQSLQSGQVKLQSKNGHSAHLNQVPNDSFIVIAKLGREQRSDLCCYLDCHVIKSQQNVYHLSN